MATHTGSEGVVYNDTNQVAEVRSFSIDEVMDTIEDTSMGDSSRSYKAGLKQLQQQYQHFGMKPTLMVKVDLMLVQK